MNSFKNLPSGWRVVRLGDVAPLQRGYDLPISNLIKGDFPVVYSNGILNYHNTFKAERPGVVTGRSGTIGKVFYIDENYWPHNTSLWVTDFYGNYPKFIYYMYSNLHLNRLSAGSTVPTLNRNDIHEIIVLMPPLKEQEKIAEILSTWDKAINLTAELIKSKKEFKKGLMQNLLTTKIRFPNFNDKWQETKLGEIVEINSYASKSKFIEPNGKYLIVDMGAVSQNGQLVTKKRTNINQDMLYKNDLVMPKDDIGGGNIIGKVARIDKNDKYICGDHVYKITTQQNAKFLYFIINSQEVNKQMRSVSTGTAQLGLAKRDVKNIKIKLPNLKEQQKIAEILIACDDEIKILENKLEKLKRQKQGLMQNLLTGKVRV
ncbi:restriction endonuclease subunit S [Campylobacter sp. RM16190]|uniref:restriction endonuclease subunit S n=1 Tax=Campylobacter sp. RM16190 TaxID=1705727 RepID=UPI001475C054|nr:restriction endonuclease subunit S [Campylobacter sp. RM16190]